MPRRLSILAAILAIVAAAAPTQAQGSCTRTGRGRCNVGNSATYAITITITRAARLELSSATVALATPTANEFDAGFGQTTGPTLTVKANAAYTVSIRSTQATWTASPAPARANKPLADLRWSNAAAGPFTAMTTTATTLRTGAAATAGTAAPIYFRVQYSWLLDTPGTYSLPIQITVTSP